jgi:hypothetical protein
MKRLNTQVKIRILIALILLILLALSAQPCLAGLIWSG